MDIIVKSGTSSERVTVQQGESLLHVLQQAGYSIDAPCGGKGICGKCRVHVEGIGHILSCQIMLSEELWQKAGLTADQPLLVGVPLAAAAQISTEGLLPDLKLNPLIFHGQTRLEAPTLSDQRPFDQRFEDESGLSVSIDLLKDIPADWITKPATISYLARKDTQSVLKWLDNNGQEPFGVAIDIGTTTLGAWLYGLESGRRLAATAMLNPQRVYGADVISRIEQAMQSPEKRKEMQRKISQAVGDLCQTLLEHAVADGYAESASVDHLGHLVLTGNTTMMHLLSGLPPATLAQTPFIPVSTRSQLIEAGELELPLPDHLVVQLMPGIASYVGADITAGIMACGLQPQTGEPVKSNRILLDIGTNGEIVLAGPKGLIACSAAAGPAFEGANIACGLGGVNGAIDSVQWQDDMLKYTVINLADETAVVSNGQHRKLRPRGLCGSGLIAAVSTCLEIGLIDETGRIADDPDQLAPSLKRYIGEINGLDAIIIATEKESETGHPIYLSQKDIREVQNAKAAMAAGIDLLIEESGITAADVEAMFVAGGFGQYIDPKHAFRIGLLPEELKGRTTAVGNTAGMGAVLCLLDRDQSLIADQASRQVRYYELSADKRFTELYVDAMLFPE